MKYAVQLIMYMMPTITFIVLGSIVIYHIFYKKGK